MIGSLSAEIRRLHLSDIIHAAQVNKWTVTDRPDGLVFMSPDEDELIIRDLAPAPVQVAEDLENLAPHHFEAKSIPFIARVGSDAAVARALAERLEEKTIPELERRVTALIARAALADVSAEAKANGWEIHWGEDSVRYLRRNDMATVAFDNIDIERLRKALGLKWVKV